MSAWLLGACVVAAAEFGSGITQSTCKHTCASANDGACDDGGLGATSDRCDYGTDCAGGALPSYADTPTNPLPHHATYTMRPLTPVNVRPLLPTQTAAPATTSSAQARAMQASCGLRCSALARATISRRARRLR